MKSKITDLIAEGTFRVPGPIKNRRTAYIAIGRPRLMENDPNGDWYAPIFIENYTKGIHKVMGASSLDTLINAMSLLNSFFHMHTISCLEFKAPRKKEQKKQKSANQAL
jgi:hypothetical protein